MPPKIQETPTAQSPNFILPDNIRIACEEIAHRCFTHSDPTKVSTISITDKIVLYPLHHDEICSKEQYFISMLSRPIFNVCEVISINGEYFSIGVDLGKIGDKQSIYEVSADIVLQSIIFHNWIDKCWLPEQDIKSIDSIGYTSPFHSNNFRYNGWTYVIFDLEGEAEFLERYLSPEQILNFMLDSVLWLYKQDPLIISDHFMDCEMGGKYFGERITEQCKKLLEIYRSTDGRELFFRQAEKSQYPGDIDGFYNTFISNIELIFNIFSKNSQALLDFVAFNKKRAQQELEALEKRTEILKKLTTST